MNHDYTLSFPQKTQETIKDLRLLFLEKIKKSPWSDLYSKIENLNILKTSEIKLDQDIIKIGKNSDLSASESCKLKQILQELIPWKKGPFSFFGFNIDSEWRSQIKWNRIQQYRSSLENKVVADIGCNNGYFMFRMAAENPSRVIGFEPHIKLKITYNLLQQAAKVKNLYFEPFGLEYINLYPNYFDTIFFLGILYHHQNPVEILKNIYKSLKKGGELIIDCQGISGDESLAYIPEKAYAGAKGMCFLPTKKALETWVRKSGYKKQKCFYAAPLSINEQRSTPWAPIKSLKEHLQANDHSKTIEGYPAPWRFYIIAYK